jgi:hypothetical protein
MAEDENLSLELGPRLEPRRDESDQQANEVKHHLVA